MERELGARGNDDDDDEEEEEEEEDEDEEEEEEGGGGRGLHPPSGGLPAHKLSQGPSW